MKKINYLLMGIMALPAVIADGSVCNKTCVKGGHMYGMKGGLWMLKFGLLKLVGVAICAFIISVIFWWTYKWIVVNKKAKKKKK